MRLNRSARVPCDPGGHVFVPIDFNLTDVRIAGTRPASGVRKLTQGRGRFAVTAVLACLAAAGLPALAQEQTPPPADAASNVTSYKPDFFTQFRPNTALDMVTRLPGFAFQDNGGGRGFAGSAGNVLIDGERPPSRSDSLSSVIARIPAGGVERIDVIRGGADGIDMQGLPIIANVIRKADTGVTGSISAGLNANDAGNASPNATLQLRNQSDGQLMEGSVTAVHSEGSGENVFVRRTLAGDVLRQGRSPNESEFNRIAATGAWEATLMGGKLRVNGQAYALNFTLGSAARFSIPGGGQDSHNEETEYGGEAGIRYSRNLDGDYALELVAFQALGSEETERDLRSAGVIGQPDFTSGSVGDRTGGESILRATLQSPAMGEWSYEGGGEVVFNFSERNNAFSFNGAPFQLGGDRSRVEELRADGFVTGKWKPSPQLNVEVGSRFEWSRITADTNAGVSEKSLTYIKPRVNLSWTPEQGTQWGARIERKVDQLDFDSFASSAAFEEEIFGVGNPEAEPEKLWEAELRYERQFGGQNSLVLSYTHKLYEDVLGRTILTVPGTPPDPDQEFEITRNGGEARVGQFNITGSLELDSWGLPGGILNIGSTLIDSELTDPVTGETHGVNESQPWTWNVGLQQTLGNGDFRWNVYLQNASTQREWLPHYINTHEDGLFVGVGVTLKPWDGWTFGMAANNLLAEDSKSRFDFYQSPRTAGALPTYRETNAGKAHRNFNLSVRKNF